MTDCTQRALSLAMDTCNIVDGVARMQLMSHSHEYIVGGAASIDVVMPVFLVEAEVLATENQVLRPSWSDINQLLIDNDTYSYRDMVAELKLEDSQQRHLVETIQDLHTNPTDDTVSVKISQLTEQLLIGNLANIDGLVANLKRSGHRSSKLTLLLEGNKLARRWLKKEYGTPQQAAKAALYPTDILIGDYLKPKLINYKPRTQKKPRQKHHDESISEPLASSDLGTTNNIEEPVFGQIAQEAAYDYFFVGGEDVPIATDIVTFLAFRAALKEIGGYGHKTTSSPVALRYQSDGILSEQTRRRIKLLGETLNGYRDSSQTQRPSNIQGLRGEWATRAACNGVDANLFFPIGTIDLAIEQTELAKAVCRSCEVRKACGGFAISNNIIDGVWGGLDETERLELRKSKNNVIQY